MEMYFCVDNTTTGTESVVFGSPKCIEINIQIQFLKFSQATSLARPDHFKVLSEIVASLLNKNSSQIRDVVVVKR